ncbi:hypothetical protein AB0N59_01905 [Microbacterium sp. NPDC089321]|uniref:hypothetical protein n=1 Tax=Microbacterium sp. NPDC089321 TaxID=3155183 RepID=UPI003420A038
MTSSAWRQEWPTYRVRLIDITARHLVDGQARASRGELPGWNDITPEHQSNFSDTVAAVFVAQARAFEEIASDSGNDQDWRAYE